MALANNRKSLHVFWEVCKGSYRGAGGGVIVGVFFENMIGGLHKNTYFVASPVHHQCSRCSGICMNTQLLKVEIMSSCAKNLQPNEINRIAV